MYVGTQRNELNFLAMTWATGVRALCGLLASVFKVTVSQHLSEIPVGLTMLQSQWK